MKKLKTTLDKTSQPVELWTSESLAGSPAVPLFLKVYAEIIESGFAIPHFLFNNNDKIVWAQRLDGTVIGGISYEYQAGRRSGFLILSFTDPKERGKGINELCHIEYENHCKSLGATCLESLVHVENKSRIASAKKVGMLPKYYRMYKSI
jgi:hypothetical protein